MALKIRPAHENDYPGLMVLYREVAGKSGGIIRTSAEINFDYINTFIENSLRNGLSLVAETDGILVAEIHAYTPEIHAFRHMLSDLTIVVHPDYQLKGIGRKLFTRFLQVVRREYPHILRVELYVREENKDIVNFYASLGFVNEGRQKNKILNANNELETPLHMVWFNPDFRIRGD